MEVKNEFSTVGELRSLLAGHSDDTGILCQVVAQENSGAWNMRTMLTAPLGPTTLILTAFHPELKSLPARQGEQ